MLSVKMGGFGPERTWVQTETVARSRNHTEKRSQHPITVTCTSFYNTRKGNMGNEYIDSFSKPSLDHAPMEWKPVIKMETEQTITSVICDGVPPQKIKRTVFDTARTIGEKDTAVQN